MSKISIVAVLLIVMGIMTSCSDFPCGRATLKFGLIGFSDTEADTIVIKRFSKTNSALIDSIVTDHIGYQRNNDTLKMVALPSDALLESEYNYEIFFPENNILIRITEIAEEQLYLKKKGLFSTTKEGCLNRITSYQKDGQTVPVVSNETYFSK